MSKIDEKNISIFRYQYSWILVPLFVYLFVAFKKYRYLSQYVLFLIGFVGITATILLPVNDFLFKFLCIIGHFPTFIWLFYNFKKYFIIDKYLLILYVIGSFLIFYIPFWPYILNRKIFFRIYNFVNLFYFLLTILL